MKLNIIFYSTILSTMLFMLWTIDYYQKMLYNIYSNEQWVGLSEQQIREIKDNNPNFLVKATEAKLKQLNTKG